jgi:hypothetical protein
MSWDMVSTIWWNRTLHGPLCDVSDFLGQTNPQKVVREAEGIRSPRAIGVNAGS